MVVSWGEGVHAGRWTGGRWVLRGGGYTSGGWEGGGFVRCSLDN